jgi:hypothetical protein
MRLVGRHHHHFAFLRMEGFAGVDDVRFTVKETNQGNKRGSVRNNRGGIADKAR